MESDGCCCAGGRCRRGCVYLGIDDEAKIEKGEDREGRVTEGSDILGHHVCAAVARLIAIGFQESCKQV